MNKIIGCGCSFTYGYANASTNTSSKNSKFALPSRVEDYVTKLSSRIGVDSINLSRPGASNYAIVKQIEHAITLDPSFVIIGTTTPLRIDFSFPERKLDSQPKINDFDYSKYESKKFVYGYKENIVSIPIVCLPDRFVYDKRFIDIFEYHSTYTNEHLKKDQDRLMLLGAFTLLNNKNIPYICVDFTELFSQGDTVNYIAYNWRELCSRFPLKNDTLHFNEDGHEFLANEILKHSKGKLT
jgi:hypothetical protein